MKGSRNNIENRGTSVVKKCGVCGAPLKSVRVIRKGKAHMIKSCNCNP